MTINKKIIKKLEATYRKHFPDEFKQYLLVQYGQEPFPYECTEHDLYIEKFCAVRELTKYVAELERIQSEHGLESPTMAERRIELLKTTDF